MVMLNGHFDGRTIVLDEPVELARGTRVKVLIDSEDDIKGSSGGTSFRPLSIRIDGELSKQIGSEKQFNVEESD